MDKEAIKKKILKKVDEAEKFIPLDLEPNLPSSAMFPDVPEWHAYEHQIWKIGSDILELIKGCPALKKDDELYQQFLKICLNRSCKRGRQSFIILFWYKQHSKYAEPILTQLDDEFITGHVLEAILKMKISGYNDLMQRYTNHKTTWIRNVAKKYLAQHKE